MQIRLDAWHFVRRMAAYVDDYTILLDAKKGKLRKAAFEPFYEQQETH